MTSRIGIVTITFALLDDMLHLPKEHHVVGIRAVDTGEVFEIAVQGPTLPLRKHGEVTPRVQYQVSMTEEPELVRKRVFTGKFSS